MNKIVLAAAGLLILGTAAVSSRPVLAQDAPSAFAAHRGGHAGGRLAKLSQELGLTGDQKAQLKPILKNTAQQVREIRQNTSLSAEEKRDQIKEVREGNRPQMMAVLTPEQRGKLKELRRRHRNSQK